MIPTLPLRLRNRLAETILAALHEAHARDELATLGGDAGARHWLAGEEPRWLAPLTERARRAGAALASRPLAPVRDLRDALAAAAVLFDAGLHFEVHELLEPHWMAAEGEARETLQGLIQAAVGYQHLANGNTAGARSLLIEAGERLHGRRVLDLDLDPFARAAAEAADRVADGRPVTPPPFPR